MAHKRKSYTAEEKAKIALEAFSGKYTLAQLSSKYQIHATQINHWKSQLKTGVVELFRDGRRRDEQDQKTLIEALYQQIGQLTIELEWMKKNLNCSTPKKHIIEPTHPGISVGRQCELLGCSRSSYYYHPVPADVLTLRLLRLIDEEYTRHPFLGTRRMCHYLRTQGHNVNRKRVQSLYHLLGIEAIYAKPKTSRPSQEHCFYPYLLRDLLITKPNQVFCADLTYIRLRQGCMYLLAIMDGYSRYVLGWSLSPTLEADFCIELLAEVLARQPCEIFNTDQGAQFTAEKFVNTLKIHNVQISMDGRGRVFDNIFIDRLWRSVKYECIYLNDFDSVKQLNTALCKYFNYYNKARLHQALNYQTPECIYYQ